MNPTQIAQLVDAASQLVQQGTKDGVKSSEFWLHIVSLLPTVLGVALGVSNPVTIGVGAAALLGSSIYSAVRGNVKATGLQVAADAMKAAASVVAQAK